MKHFLLNFRLSGTHAALLVLSSLWMGCGSFSAEGIDGFTPLSQVWTIEMGAERSHYLRLTSVAGYCDKRKNAEQDRIDADRRRGEREAAGEPTCASLDLWYDDLADAYAPLEGSGARYLEIQLDRPDSPNEDSRTAPSVGNFAHFGSNNDGSYWGQIRYFDGSYWQGMADAYECLDEESSDEEQVAAFLNEEEPDLRQIWGLSGGAVELSQDTADKWTVNVEADITSEASDTVGSVIANFAAERCEITVGEATF